MNKKELISIRNAEPTDFNLILATWVHGLYHGSDDSWITNTPEDIFNSHYRVIVQKILEKPTVSIKIACLKDDDDVILGYSVFEENVLHWVYVKTTWRGIGLARDIVKNHPKFYTHMTPTGRSIAKKLKMIFNPFRL